MTVFAFNATPSHADEKAQCKWIEVWQKCEKYRENAQIDELQDSDQADNERDVADSGEEGSTSAAEASEQ